MTEPTAHDDARTVTHHHTDGITHTHALFIDPDVVHSAGPGNDHGPAHEPQHAPGPIVDKQYGVNPRRPVPTPPDVDELPPPEPGQSDADRLDAIRKAHAARQHEDAAHQARMRRAGAAVLGTSKGLEPAARPAVAGIITLDSNAGQWPIVIDGMPLPWYVDQAIRVDYSNEVDGLGRLWVGIIAEAIHVDQMPYPDRRHQSERERLYKDLNAKGLEAAAWHAEAEAEHDRHDETIGRLTRTRRRLARVHQAATRLATERDEARGMAMRAEIALTSLASNQATLALAVVEAGGAGVAVPGDVDMQATLTIRRLTQALAARDAQTAGLQAELDAARAHAAQLEGSLPDVSYTLTVDEAAAAGGHRPPAVYVPEDITAGLQNANTALGARVNDLEDALESMTLERDALAAQINRLEDATAAPDDTPAIVVELDGTPPTVAEALERTRARAQAAIDDRARIAALEDDARRRDDAEVAELAHRRAHETDGA